MRVTIGDYELSDKEVEVLKQALDYYTRGCQGQFSELGHQFWLMMQGRLPAAQLRKVKELLDSAQTELHGSTSLCYRLGSNLIGRSAVHSCRLSMLLEGDADGADKVLDLLGFNSLDQDIPGGKRE